MKSFFNYSIIMVNLKAYNLKLDLQKKSWENIGAARKRKIYF